MITQATAKQTTMATMTTRAFHDPGAGLELTLPCDNRILVVRVRDHPALADIQGQVAEHWFAVLPPILIAAFRAPFLRVGTTKHKSVALQSRSLITNQS